MAEITGKYEVEENDANAFEMMKGEQPAAEIYPPKTIPALYEKGLGERKVWGWVKISATFINHIKKLRGAKLAIWQVISLSIDENGSCSLPIQEIADLSGYSYSETHASIQELEDMGYLSAAKEKGKKSLYSPKFAARGVNQPKDNPSRKARGIDKVPLQPTGGHPSSPAIENALPSIKELKELTTDQLSFLKKAGLEWILLKGDVSLEEIEKAIEEAKRKETVKPFENALGFSNPLPWWSNKDWTEFAEWVIARQAESPTCFGEYNIWRNTPFTKGTISNNRIRGFVKEFYDSWDMFMMSKGKPGVIGSVVQAVQNLIEQPEQDWRKALPL
jgi:hypothetical protein